MPSSGQPKESARQNENRLVIPCHSQTYTYANPGSTKAVNQREARENKQVFSHDPDIQKTQN